MSKTKVANSLVAVLSLCLASLMFTPSAEAQEQDNARIRFGVDGGLGVGVLTTTDPDQLFGALAASARLGIQFNSLIGVYYQMGGWALGRESGSSYHTVGDWSHTANIDFTLGSFFQFGAGAGVDLVGQGLDAFPSLDARLAFLIGTHGPGARGAFSLGLKAHVAFDVSGPNVGVLAIPLIFAGFELF